jgi:uroporphyrinogen decarboxylase
MPAATLSIPSPRTLYLDTLLFRKPARVPFDPGHGRRSTIETWQKQGLPKDAGNINDYVKKILGIPHQPWTEFVWPGVDLRMIPMFEEKVLERRPAPPDSKAPGSLIVQDWKGNICEISDEFDVSYLRNAIDFVTRSWLKCPVESPADWQAMKRRYDVADPARFPKDWPEQVAKLQARNYPSTLSFSGPFWQLREWLGFENLCMAFLDDPKFVHEMIDFWDEFVGAMLEKTFQNYVPDGILINEDMAYKEKPMIGPAMTREFLVPCWKRWIGIARKAGVKILEVDSDGHIGELLPCFIEAGLNCNSPLEVAAGNDLPAYRQRYGTQMAYKGGVDKRAMAAGGSTIRKEIARLKPVIDAGGFIPSCDHGVPADVSWPNFVDYCRLLAEATGWL